MKAIKIIAPQELVYTEVPVPEIAADEVLIKVKFAGICGSDVHIYHGKHQRAQYPLIMGHEMAGEIVAAGKGCRRNWQSGDKVVVNPLLSCGHCDACTNGNKHVCVTLGLLGIDTDGSFAEYVKAREDMVIHIPEGIEFDTAALAEPFAVGIHAVTISGLKIGDKVVILGGGPIGLMVALAARAAGAGMVAVSEVSEFRLAKAKKMGFIALNARENIKEKVLELTSGVGADIVFEAAATSATSAQMTGLLRTRGLAVIVGVHPHLVNVDLLDVNQRELRIAGTRVYTGRDFETALQVMREVKELDEVITHRLPLQNAAEGFNAMIEARDSLKVLLRP